MAASSRVTIAESEYHVAAAANRFANPTRALIHCACASAKRPARRKTSIEMPAANTAPKITPREAARLIDDLSAIVARAAAAILAYPFSEVARRVKADRSPVTAADLASEQVILERLASLLPGLPVVAEESGTGARTALGASLALVDPLDGTKEFLAGRDEYSVNLALVTDGTPIAGVIAAPARGLMWRGVVGAAAERLRLAWNEGPNRASERRAIRTRRPAPAELTVLT